jgi:hypothetical protein
LKASPGRESVDGPAHQRKAIGSVAICLQGKVRLRVIARKDQSIDHVIVGDTPPRLQLQFLAMCSRGVEWYCSAKTETDAPGANDAVSISRLSTSGQHLCRRAL